MQKIGLVEKQDSPRDARVSLVGLTDSGMTLYSNAKKDFEGKALDLFSSLNNQQQNALDTVSKIRL
jgi:DNA-binding MarR family transcriptional regulator